MKNQTKFRLFFGIDWADEKHDAYVIDSDGQGKHETIIQTADEIQSWLEEKRQQAGDHPIAIIFESCRNGFMQSLILREGITLFPVNPKQFSRCRERYHNPAVRKLALRWIRILFRVWKDKTPYDQEKYLKSITQNIPPKTLYGALSTHSQPFSRVSYRRLMSGMQISPTC